MIRFSRLLVCLFALTVSFFSCKHADEKHTDSGMKYTLYKENPGPKAKIGDFVTLDMIYKTENDSVLFDSKKNKMPLRFQLEKPPFSGSMEDGLTYLAAGDSATFFVSADSMVQKVFSKMGGNNYVRPAFLKTGSFLKFDIRLLKIQSELDAAEEMYRELDKRSALEKSGIEKYITDHHVTEKPDSSGIYIIRSTEGKGAVADTGKTVSFHCTGKFLNGEVFDSNSKEGITYSFIVGRGEVIKGWDVAFRKLRQGDKATLVVPSAMAYGETGVRNKMNGTFIIQPNTPLVFEVDVVAVK